MSRICFKKFNKKWNDLVKNFPRVEEEGKGEDKHQVVCLGVTGREVWQSWVITGYGDSVSHDAHRERRRDNNHIKRVWPAGTHLTLSR